MLATAVGGGAGSARLIPACRLGPNSFQLTDWNVSGNVLVAAGIVTKGGPVCKLKTTVRIGVRYHPGNLDPPHGPVRPVRGNPTRWDVSRVLHPWSQVVHTWTWRNWCGRPRSVFVFFEASQGNLRSAQRVTAPACRNRHAGSVFVDTGSGTRPLPVTGDRMPAHILSPDTPVRVSPTLIRVQNAWLVSDGRTLVAVYAGEAGNDPAHGRFVILRYNNVFGVQSLDVVSAGHTGAVKLTQVPLGSAVETSAQRGNLAFTSAGGEHGVLRLATDTVTIAP